MRIQSFAVLAALAISPLTAQATTIGFEDLASPYNLSAYNSTETDDGFTFSAEGLLIIDDTTNNYSSAAAGNFYMLNNYDSPITLTATNGSAFSLNDFFIEAFDQITYHELPITVRGFLNGVQVGNTLSFTDTTSWQDIYVNFPDVTSVVISGYEESLDNITVNDPTDVPEPATLALFATGLLCLGAIYRRRSGASPAI